MKHQNEYCSGILKYTLPNGLKEETKITASNRGNLFRNVCNMVVTIRMTCFNNQDFSVIYEGDCERIIKMAISGYDIKKLAKEIRAVNNSRTKLGVTLINRSYK